MNATPRLVGEKGPELLHMNRTEATEAMERAEKSGPLAKRKEFLNRHSDRRWYSMSNKTGDVAKVRIYDEIGFFGITADDFVKELDDITAPEIVVAISSPGGDIFDGIAIYNALRVHKAKVTTRVDSMAGSIASVIVQAGEKRIMLTGSQMMIHDAWGLSVGNAEDMREMADILDLQSDIIAAIYAERAGGAEEFWRDKMRTESWFKHEEAVEVGLADEAVDPASDEVQAVALAKRTLNDEIEEAMGVVSDVTESAERVAALRAEKGKQLSTVNSASLDELRDYTDRLQQLLTATKDETPVVADDLDTALADLKVLTDLSAFD